MAKENNNKKNEGKKNEQEIKNKSGSGGGGGKKTAEGKEPITVVLKTELHCEGCASKLSKAARSLQGVESAKADMSSGKLTVVGWVDPAEVRDYLQEKLKRKVDLVSPQPKKEDKNKGKDKEEKKEVKDNKKPDADGSKNNKKPKEAQVTSAEIKMAFHCQGCIEKILKFVSKTNGVQESKIDKQKETVTVIGTMDVKALTEALTEKFKLNVEIVSPKKEKGKEENVGGSGGNEGGKKKKGGGGDGGGDGNVNGGGGGENRMEFLMRPGFGPGYGSSVGPHIFGPGLVGQPVFGPGYVGQPVYPAGFVSQPVYGYGQGNVYGHGYGPENGYGSGSVPSFPAHMKFNDENPNACSVM